eukprot:TRINITY_DN5608_c0_g1_i2.p1 TRINITY_DN5608_c0_g1~~TRINITY_DN5608_c0_g1_i2.p1  ORF type:complete len:305 (-),score=37.32 TRINITY_DN5608_c0_g1_i2:77-967(-)
MNGKYYAELLKIVLARTGSTTKMEWRTSIYGASTSEWHDLAQWVHTNDLQSPDMSWVVQVPRQYSTLKRAKTIYSMQDMLTNVFKPLFEITNDPSADPLLHELLKDVSGFDSVDLETVREEKLTNTSNDPAMWNGTEEPPYNYYLYFMWANIASLNNFRRLKGMNTFAFRPHSGNLANSDVSHVAGAFLLAHGISHGLNLTSSPGLQYLYYLMQIPMAMSPLSENSLSVILGVNPFATFFQQGMNVTLSTDNPLLFHNTQEPLMEEYAISRQLHKWDICDLCEIARNGVLMSGFTA